MALLKTITCVAFIAACCQHGVLGQGYHSQRFKYDGTDAKIIWALTTADSIYNIPAFWQKVREYPQQKIANSSYTMAMLADALQNTPCAVAVIMSSGTHSSTAQTGRDEKTHNLRISLNNSGYQEDRKALAVTFIHEWVHAVDYTLNGNTPLKFAHFSGGFFSYLNEKGGRCKSQDTAAYRIERVADIQFGWPDYVLGLINCRYRPEFAN